jgi:hypothetical protein
MASFGNEGTMKKTRITDEQMLTILREADQRPVPEVTKDAYPRRCARMV